MITCRGTGGPTGKLGAGQALLRCHFSLGPNLQAPKVLSYSSVHCGTLAAQGETRTHECATR